MNHSQQSQPRRERLALLALGIGFIALTCWSWGRWMDVQVDFGLQLYTPWQLAQGKVLYRDVSYIAGGPLSQYYHALLFKFFGVSIRTIILSNLVIAWLVTWGLFHLFTRAAGWATGLVVGLATLGVFVFGHLTYVGNFNFITPYTCETVHGFALSLLAIACLSRWLATDGLKWLFSAGAAAGAVFLTKPELFAALTAAVAAGVLMHEIGQPNLWVARARRLLVLAGGALLPVGLFAAYFVAVWPTRQGLLSVAGAWLPLLGGKAGHGQYYDWCMGLDVPGKNLLQMLQYSAAFLVVLLALAVGGWFCKRRRYFPAVIIWSALAGFLWSPLNRLQWVEAGRVLPLLTVFLLGVFGWSGWQAYRTRQASPATMFPMLWSVFALLLLLKMGLNARLWQYGYYLALPATTLVLLWLMRLLPDWLVAFEVDRKIFRVAMIVFLAAGLVSLLARSNYYYAMKTFTLGAGGDRIRFYPEDVNPAGQCIAESVKWLQSRTRPAETLAVWPEGVMVNYLARRANPTPYVVACPHELQVAGEAQVAATYAAQPPQWLLLMHRSTAEFGVGFFGASDGYGQSLARLIGPNYSPEWVLGGEPLVTNRFGMKMLRRNGL